MFPLKWLLERSGFLYHDSPFASSKGKLSLYMYYKLKATE